MSEGEKEESMDGALVGSSGTELTLDHLRYAIEHMRSRCAQCGGSGSVMSEAMEHYEARIATAYVVRGFVTVGESMMQTSECPRCRGTGRDPSMPATESTGDSAE